MLVLLGADVLEVTAKTQAHMAAPLHIAGPWLQLLLWLADARWRKLGAAAPVEQVQQVLDCLQGYVALLWTAAPPQPPSHDSSEQTNTWFWLLASALCIPRRRCVLSNASHMLTPSRICQRDRLCFVCGWDCNGSMLVIWCSNASVGSAACTGNWLFGHQ